MPESLASHVAAANAKQGRGWREDEARKTIITEWRWCVATGDYGGPKLTAKVFLADYRPADLLAALRTVSGEEEFGREPGRTWIERVTEAVEDLISEEEG